MTPQVVSVVIPVYNRADCLATAIESVLTQSCGLEHLEVILVDDGSTDGSGAICDDYAARLPERVRVVHQDNQGVAAALNSGVEAASGDLVGFLGSDDYLSSDALAAVLEFFAEHWDECDLAAIGIEMFGSRTGRHWNNGRRFSDTRVIDVNREWNLVQQAGGGSFIKAEVFRDWGLRFDPLLFISEDATLNAQVILRRMAYGVIAGPTYYNRRYEVGGASQVASSHHRPEYFDVIVDRSYGAVFDAARELHGEIPRYAQAMCAYGLTFRFRGHTVGLREEDRGAYEARLAGLLKQISIPVLRLQRASIEQRLNMMSLREDHDLPGRVAFANGVFRLEGTAIYSFRPGRTFKHPAPTAQINFFEVAGRRVTITGEMLAPELTPAVSFELRVGTRRYPLTLQPAGESSLLVNDVPFGRQFRLSVEHRPGETLGFVVVVAREGSPPYRAPVRLRFGRFAGFAGDGGKIAYLRDSRDGLWRQTGDFGVARIAPSGRNRFRQELSFLWQAAAAGAPGRILRLRASALWRRRQRGSDVWLLADHKLEAGDNGEAMFRYLCGQAGSGVRPVFVLARSAPQFSELSKLGTVVEPGSREMLRHYLSAGVVLNSAADEYMINPLGADRAYLEDLLPPVSVFLQHGVVLHDLSEWLRRTRKGFDVVVTSAERERAAMLAGRYDYEPRHVALVGLPRFDRLTSSPQRLLLFAPTWRKWLVGGLDPDTGRNGANPEFARSDYFRRWQAVLTDERLERLLESHDYRGLFVLHPSHSAELGKFSGSRRIAIARYPFDYRDLFRRGDLLVTDYSSVAFDFAYLRKPVVYLQPDREEFFANHLFREGYFSYEQDGFGPVVDSHDGLIDQIEALLTDPVGFGEEYRGRADSFFAFADAENSARLHRYVLEGRWRPGAG